jgi:hypothetical protein
MSRQMAANPAHCAMLIHLSLVLKWTVSGRAADCCLARAGGTVDRDRMKVHFFKIKIVLLRLLQSSTIPSTVIHRVKLKKK